MVLEANSTKERRGGASCGGGSLEEKTLVSVYDGDEVCAGKMVREKRVLYGTKKMKSRKKKPVPGIDGEEKQSSARACPSIGRVGPTSRESSRRARAGQLRILREEKARPPNPRQFLLLEPLLGSVPWSQHCLRRREYGGTIRRLQHKREKKRRQTQQRGEGLEGGRVAIGLFPS